MINLLLVTNNKNNWLEFIKELNKYKITLKWAENGNQAMDNIRNDQVNLIISDEKLDDMSGLDLILNTIKINPMINFAVVSSLSEKEFHDVSEGLGVLVQLPVKPNKHDAENIISQLKKVS